MDTTAQITSGSWQFYQYTYGQGLRASISFCVEAAQESRHVGHPHCRRVVLHSPDERVYANGLPMADEHERLGRDEQALVRELDRSGVDCRLVGRMSYGAMRDLVFQVEDVNGFEAAYPRWSKLASGRHELIRREGGWDFFDTKVRPKREHWEWIENAAVVRNLLQHGSNEEQLHRLDHNFHGANIDALAAELSARGFDKQHRPGAGALIVHQDAHLDVDEITTWTLRLGDLARHFGVEYDGWGAAIVG